MEVSVGVCVRVGVEVWEGVGVKVGVTVGVGVGQIQSKPPNVVGEQF